MSRTARTEGLTITHAIDTHIHADFVSGARELAAIGAEVDRRTRARGSATRTSKSAHGESTAARRHRADCSCTRRDTRRSTSRSSEPDPGEPARVFTGDTLFVGAVGRPDLLGEAAMRQLAGQLYDSLFDTLLQLPDDGRGVAGAWRGIALRQRASAPRRTRPSATSGAPIRSCATPAASRFVDAVLADLPDTPPYFPRMKQLNQAGAPVLGLASGVAAPPAVSAADAAAAAVEGAW